MANAKYSLRSSAPHKPRDHYQELTDRIIAALEAGTRPWQKPWDPDKAGGPSMPVNAATGRRYRGINTLILGMSSLAFTSNDPRFCTYKQAAERGWQIRRGEKGTTVYFFKQLTIGDHELSRERRGPYETHSSIAVFHRLSCLTDRRYPRIRRSNRGRSPMAAARSRRYYPPQ